MNFRVANIDGRPERRTTIMTDKTEPAPPCLALRLREAARALNISERTLWSWTKAGHVPHIKRGRLTLYPIDALRRWLDEKTRAPENAA